MPRYDFRSLSSIDFEALTRDLLSRDLKVRFEAFKPGKDKGIDLRYAHAADNPTIVVQCKHYVGSPFPALLRDIQKKELPKIQKLAPKRYILVTSAGLSPDNKSKLLSALTPYCSSTGDILGADDVNGLLARHSDVEKAHLKLWLSSAAVLDRLLHAAVYTQTEMGVGTLKDRISRYVQNESLNIASDTLRNFHYCIICGIPGIGKTMLAEMLMAQHIAKGFQPIRVSANINEALSVYQEGKKQFFYYDDFLGQSSGDEKLGKNEDQLLLEFCRRVSESKRHRFVLTTREYILEQAKARYERLDTSDFDLRRCTIKLEHYTTRHRAEILFNHLYFSKLPKQHLEEFVAQGAHRQVVRHYKFSPRIIDWLTTSATEHAKTGAEFIEQLLQALNDPTRMWHHAFKNISHEAQALSLVLSCLPRDTTIEDLERSFLAAIPRLVQGTSPIGQNALFLQALKEVDGSFVRTNRDMAWNRHLISLHNPSIADILHDRLRSDGPTALALLETAATFDQVHQLATVLAGTIAVKGSFEREWTRTLAAALLRTFDSAGCNQWHRDRAVGTGAYQARWGDMRPEARLQTALRIAAQYDSAEIWAAVDALERQLAERWRRGDISNSEQELEGVLSALAEASSQRARKPEGIAFLKTSLLDNPTSAADFTRLMNIVDRHAPLNNDELDRVRAAFTARHTSLVLVDDLDSDSAIWTLNELEEVADWLELDELKNEIDAARDEVRRAKEEPDEEPEGDDDDDRSTTSGEFVSDSDLDDLFSALVD